MVWWHHDVIPFGNGLWDLLVNFVCCGLDFLVFPGVLWRSIFYLSIRSRAGYEDVVCIARLLQRWWLGLFRAHWHWSPEVGSWRIPALLLKSSRSHHSLPEHQSSLTTNLSTKFWTPGLLLGSPSDAGVRDGTLILQENIFFSSVVVDLILLVIDS